ncbi:putative two-component system sensor kinase [Patulibacter medicamentivorans]|uniref:histidine kinase n=1 Tax=Patulibacter medicamentivorans TaxID=1097667 RepID=H0EBP7_9ACTN|nr:sensor histidine kinase [Patulibacter medicamentivorans]EHN08909.1 putative two-component system sensor kinase [Patulibacter medicamentivorans]
MPRARWSGWSLARRLLVLQLAVVAVVVAIGALITIDTARDGTYERHRDRSLAVARTLAGEPAVRQALAGPDPTASLQPLAERVRRTTGVSFITIMRPDRTRLTHPDPAQIGRPFVGRIDPALRGRTFTERYTGTLGPSVRAVSPVYDTRGRIVGLVAVGVLLDRIGDLAADQVPRLLLLALATFAIGGTLSLLLARRIRRQTLGLGPERIAALYQHHDATLHAIREGVLVTDAGGRPLLVNDEARRLLDLPDGEPDALDGGSRLDELVHDPGLRAVIAGDRPLRDETLLVGDRVLLVSHAPTSIDGRAAGSVTTLRDRTELEALSRELDAVRGMADALRAQSHEAANRLHTIVGLVELGRTDEAIRFGSDQAAVAGELLARLEERIDEPALVALLLGKVATAGERGSVLRIADDSAVPATGLPAADLVTIVGNLVDNALDAAAGRPDPAVEIDLRRDGATVVVVVADRGPGLPPGDPSRLFEPGFTTKPAGPGGRGIGLALVARTARRLGGSVVARDRPGGGAEVTVRLPLPHAASPPPARIDP